MNIATIQQRLEAKCRVRAGEEAKRIVSSLPFIGDIKVWSDTANGIVKIRSDTLNDALTMAFLEALFTQYVKEETRKLLDLIDNVEYLKEAVENK